MATRNSLATVAALLTLIGLCATAPAQEIREQAAAALRKPEVKEMDPTFTKAAPFAQKLVDEPLAEHPQVLRSPFTRAHQSTTSSPQTSNASASSATRMIGAAFTPAKTTSR